MKTLNNETIELTIPVELKEAIQKIVNKSNKLVNDISLTFGKDYMKAYTHTFTWYDDDHRPHQKREVQMHDVCDMVLVIPSESDWTLKCYYDDGMLVVTDLKKELVIKNPAHGKDYHTCDCCMHHISRYTYLIENRITGEELQVGKECLKKYNLESFTKIWRMIDDALGLSRYAREDFGFGSSDTDFDEWGYKGVNTGKQSILVREMIRSARAFYIERSGEWTAAYWDGRRYYKSLSGIALQEFTWNPANFSHIPDEYVDKLLNFVKVNIGEKLAKADIDDYEFERDMLDSLSNVYMPLCLCHYAFFAVKKYEQFMERERQRLEMERLGKLEVGQQLHVRGEVISHKTYEGYFGKYDVYEVRTEKGYTLRRKGVIPVGKDNKTTEFYAQVLGISSNGVVSLDRATKNPKKNVQYVAI